MSVQNFSSLARLEVPEKFLWWVGWGVQSHFRVKPNRCVEVRLGLGFWQYMQLLQRLEHIYKPVHGFLDFLFSLFSIRVYRGLTKDSSDQWTMNNQFLYVSLIFRGVKGLFRKFCAWVFCNWSISFSNLSNHQYFLSRLLIWTASIFKLAFVNM